VSAKLPPVSDDAQPEQEFSERSASHPASSLSGQRSATSEARPGRGILAPTLTTGMHASSKRRPFAGTA
jgi:hypothetical protein